VTDRLDFDQVLDICLDRLQAGNTVQACLISYPSHAGRLAPLLHMALKLQTSQEPSMSTSGFRAGEARLLAYAMQLSAQRQGALPVRRRGAVSRLIAGTRRLAAAVVVGMLLFCALLSAGAVTVSAASASLPGSSLYTIKRTTESLLSSLAFTPRLQTQVHLAWAERRLDEVGALIARDGIVYKTVLAALEHETEQALVAAEQAGPESLTDVIAHTEHQHTVLRHLLDQAPEAARSDLQQALATSTEMNERAWAGLAGETPAGLPISPAPYVTLQPLNPTDTPQPPGLTETPRTIETTEVSETPGPTGSPTPIETPQPLQATATPVIPTPTPTATAQPLQATATPVIPTATAASHPLQPTVSPATPTATATPQPPQPTVSPVTPTATATPQPPQPTATPVTPTATATPQPPTATATPQPAQEPTSDIWDKSSLVIVNQGSDCEGSGNVWVTVKNSGSEAMASPTPWELWYASSGSPKSGEVIATGEIPVLDVEQTYLISTAAIRGSGKYMFKAYQRPGHPGTGVLWSDGITFDTSQCGN
jgi:YqxM protein